MTKSSYIASPQDGNMKGIMVLIAALIFATALSGQSVFPYDTVTREVVYKQSFKLSPKAKVADVYAIAQKWFDDPAKFTQKNAEPPVDSTKVKKKKRQQEVYDHYANPRPLQVQDPNANKLLGMGMLRYYSSSNNSIKLIYLKYDVSIEVKAGSAVMTVLRIHYFHYNPGNYNEAPIYGFGSSKPCDEMGTIESLIACENFHAEFQALAAYCNKEVNGLFADFKNTLKLRSALYDPKLASTASASKGAKPASKKPVTKSGGK